MIIQYKVGNYKSIKDDLVINFTSTQENSDSKLVNKQGNMPYNMYKVIGLIGPNASGKSNILESFEFAVRFIQRTIQRKETELINVEPFMLDETSANENTFFEFIFIENAIKYVYGFEINKNKVEEEYLFAYYTKKPTTIFERSNGKYDFKGNDVKIQTENSQKTNDNRLYLPVAAEWGYEKVIDAYKWFDRIFEDIYANSSLLIANMIDNNQKDIIIETLKKADINISDIYVKNKKIEKKELGILMEFLSKLIDDFDPLKMPEETPEIYITHSSESGQEFSLSFNEDSSGTRDIIKNLAEAYHVNEKGGILIEDEFGKYYHTKLTQYFLNNIIDRNSEFDNIQMLFASHDTKILNCLNPEQIYLVDKDDEGATFVKLLDDYCIREKDNIELGYLKGRYGAIPYTKA